MRPDSHLTPITLTLSERSWFALTEEYDYFAVISALCLPLEISGMGEDLEWKLTPSHSIKVTLLPCSIKGRGLTPVFVKKKKKKDEIIAGKSGFPLCSSWCWRIESVSLPGYILFYIRNAEQKGWCTAWQTPFFIGQVPVVTVANRINWLHWWQLLKPAYDQHWVGLSKMKGRWGSPGGCPMAVGYQGVHWQDEGNGFKLNKGRLRLDSGLHVGRTHAQNPALCSPCCIGSPWCLPKPLLPSPKHSPDGVLPPHSNPLFSLHSQFFPHILNGRNSHLRPWLGVDGCSLSSAHPNLWGAKPISSSFPPQLPFPTLQLNVLLQIHGGNCLRAVLMLGQV